MLGLTRVKTTLAKEKLRPRGSASSVGGILVIRQNAENVSPIAMGREGVRLAVYL